MEYLRWILILGGAALLVTAVLLGRRRVDVNAGIRRRAEEASRQDLNEVSIPLSQQRSTYNKNADSTDGFLSDAEIDNVLPKMAYDPEPAGIEVNLDISDEFEIEEKPEPVGAKGKVKSFANAVRKAQTSAQSPLAEELTSYNEHREVEIEEKIVAIHVTAQSGREFGGRQLRSAFETHGYEFGDMSIYHCLCEGERIFSIANMVKPGTFDPDAMDGFSTPGIALFMRLPVSLDSDVAFELLIGEAQELAEELGGQVRDADRNTLTRQTEQHLRDEIQRYAFKQKHTTTA